MCRVWLIHLQFLWAHWKSDFKGRAYEHDLWHHKYFGSQSWSTIQVTQVYIHWESPSPVDIAREWTLQRNRRDLVSNTLTSEIKYIYIFIYSGWDVIFKFSNDIYKHFFLTFCGKAQSRPTLIIIIIIIITIIITTTNNNNNKHYTYIMYVYII